MGSQVPIEESRLAAAAVACHSLGFGAIISAALLRSGMQCAPIRLVTASGPTLVVKQHPAPPPCWFEWEADGLRTIASVSGGPRVPRVYACSETFLLMEDFGEAVQATDRAWEDFGRAIAALHNATSASFGYDGNNYLGITLQNNPRMTDGHAFFIEHRIRRYLRLPGCERWLTRDDRVLIDRWCERIVRDVPVQPPSLLHGDLHCANVLGTARGDIVTFDPAVFYGWAEADLSLADQYGGFPEPFWKAYVEVHPLADGWRGRLALYSLKELLSMIDQFGDQHGSLTALRTLAARFA